MAAVKAKTRGPLDDLQGASQCCALGRIRTCNLLIRSQMLYPLSYECLASRFFLPVGVAGTTLHERWLDAKSVLIGTAIAPLTWAYAVEGAWRRLRGRNARQPRPVRTGLPRKRRLRDLNPGWAINPNRISSAAP